MTSAYICLGSSRVVAQSKKRSRFLRSFLSALLRATNGRLRARAALALLATVALLAALRVALTTSAAHGDLARSAAEQANKRFFNGPYSPLPYDVPKDPYTWPLPWGSETNYVRIRPLGSGSFGSVWLARDVRTNSTVAVKLINDIGAKYVVREINAMRAMASENVLRLVDAFVDHTGLVSIVFEALLDTEPTKDVGKGMSEDDVRYYFEKLLRVLVRAKERGWLHRDIDQGNLLIAPRQRQLLVIDWGMAVVYHGEDNVHSTNVGGRGFQAPEILLDHDEYDFAIDMWSAGVLFGSWLFGRDELFPGKKTSQTLDSMTHVLGTHGLYSLVDAHDLYLSPKDVLKFGNRDATPLQLMNRRIDRDPHPDAVDLLSKILVWDPEDRISPEEALKHSYFTNPGRRVTKKDP